jgi:hypothetical protein
MHNDNTALYAGRRRVLCNCPKKLVQCLRWSTWDAKAFRVSTGFFDIYAGML